MISNFLAQTPDPTGGDSFVAFQQAFHKAFPDWSFHLKKVEQVADDRCEVCFQISGTHSKKLKLPLDAVGELPPTGTEIVLPVESADFRFYGGKISEIHEHQASHGGLPGIFEQLGLE